MATDPEIAAFRTTRRRKSLWTLAIIITVVISAAVVWILLRPGPCDALADEICAPSVLPRSTCSVFRKGLENLGATGDWCQEVKKAIQAVPIELKSGVFIAALQELVDETIGRLEREGAKVPEQVLNLRKILEDRGLSP